MTFRLPLVSLILFSFMTISACTDSGSGSGSGNGGSGGLVGQPRPLDRIPDDDPLPPPVEFSTELAAIAGLWNNSIAEDGPGEIDVFYLEITAAGLWNNFDYRGDNVDQGANCYVNNSGQISSLGGTNYRVSLQDMFIEFSAVVENGRLVLTGNLGTVTLPAVVGLSSVDFNLC